MKTRMLSIVCVVALSGAMLLTACKEKPPAKAPAPTTSAKTPTTSLPADLFASTVMPGARSVAEVKADASVSGEVVIQGRIGGRKQPFVDGVAMFLMADASMKSCDQLHGDTCKKPWDYCCEPAESLAAKIATIQVVGADGKPLRVGIQGQHGVEPLVTVTVAGNIVNREAGSLLINARKIHVASAGG